MKLVYHSIDNGRVRFFDETKCEHVYSVNEVIRCLKETPWIFSDESISKLEHLTI